jgi:hypothetical protein
MGLLFVELLRKILDEGAMNNVVNLRDAPDQGAIEADYAGIEARDEGEITSAVEATRSEQGRELAVVHLRRIAAGNFDDKIADTLT